MDADMTARALLEVADEISGAMGENTWSSRIRAIVSSLEGQAGHEVRLWDSQWVNIVNHENAYANIDKEDAIAIAVKLTEKAMARNVAEGNFPPAARTAQSKDKPA